MSNTFFHGGEIFSRGLCPLRPHWLRACLRAFSYARAIDHLRIWQFTHFNHAAYNLVVLFAVQQKHPCHGDFLTVAFSLKSETHEGRLKQQHFLTVVVATVKMLYLFSSRQCVRDNIELDRDDWCQTFYSTLGVIEYTVAIVLQNSIGTVSVKQWLTWASGKFFSRGDDISWFFQVVAKSTFFQGENSGAEKYFLLISS